MNGSKMVPACHGGYLLDMGFRMSSRITSRRYEGVSYRESKTRKHHGKPDRTYSYTLRDQAGQKIYVKVGRASEGVNEDLANQARVAAQKKVHQGEEIDTFAARKKNTLDRIVNAYLEWKQADGKHVAEERSRYDDHIKPTFGPLQVSHISLEAAEKFKSGKMSAGLSSSSVKKIFTLMRAAVNFAIKRKMYKGGNPFDARSGFAMPRENNKAERFLTAQEAKDLLAELERRSQQLRDIAFVSLYSGMRATEIFGLKGADIDENNSLAIITAKGGKREIVPLRPQVLAVLLLYRTSTESLLFPNMNGVRYWEIPDTFMRAVNAVGLNNSGAFALNEKGGRAPVLITDRKNRVIFHTLRHTFAS